MFVLQGREEALVSSQIEEEQRVAELRRAQAALQEKQEKNDKKKENEEFLDSLVMLMKLCVCHLCRFKLDLYLVIWPAAHCSVSIRVR